MTPVYKLSDARSLTGTATYYSSMLAGNAAFNPSSSYDLLQTEYLSANATTIEFNNLSTYATMYNAFQIKFSARVTENIGGNIGTFYVNVNNDTNANYSRHILRWNPNNSSTPTSSGLSGTATPDVGHATGSGAGAGVFATGIMEIVDPFSSSKNLVIKTMSGSVNPQEVGTFSVMWNNAQALDVLSFETYGVHSFVPYTRFSLYGRGGG